MKLVTYRRLPDDAGRLGIWHQSLIIDAARFGEAVGAPVPATMLGLIDLGPTAITTLKALLASYIDGTNPWPLGTTLAASDARLLAPIPRPRKNIFGIGLNYAKHVDESARSLDTSAEMPTQPVIFSKPPTTVIGPGEPIRHNGAITQQLDWEVEIAVVIGAGGTNIPEQQAMEHVFGYTIINDVSARDNRRQGQWIVSKGMDSQAPMGPCLVTADAIADPHALRLTLSKNGESKQDGNSAAMIFKIPALIADISAHMRLEPGDIIATGTPDGVGAGREPQEWMWPGDVITCTVEGIGTLTNPVIRVD